MILNRERKFIFIHIPKAAGTFVMRFLLEHVPGCERINLDGDGHYGISKALALVPEEEWEQYYSFCVVRNPYDWYVSLYAHNRRYNAHEWRLWGKGCAGFRQWCAKMLRNRTEPETVHAFKDDHTSTATLYKAMATSRLKVGWLTHRLIYSNCLDWEDAFRTGQFPAPTNFRLRILRTELIRKQLHMIAPRLGLTTKEEEAIDAYPAQNVSGNRQPFGTYYSQELQQLLERKEHYLLDRWGYEYPREVK